MNIVYYRVLSSRSEKELSELVNEALDDEMQPFGSVSVAVATDSIDQEVYFIYAQAMVSYETTSCKRTREKRVKP